MSSCVIQCSLHFWWHSVLCAIWLPQAWQRVAALVVGARSQWCVLYFITFFIKWFVYLTCFFSAFLRLMLSTVVCINVWLHQLFHVLMFDSFNCLMYQCLTPTTVWCLQVLDDDLSSSAEIDLPCILTNGQYKFPVQPEPNKATSSAMSSTVGDGPSNASLDAVTTIEELRHSISTDLVNHLITVHHVFLSVSYSNEKCF